MRKTKSYHESLMEDLKDPREAAGYLTAALEDGNAQMFLVALRHVAEARGGMANLSQSAGLNRANLYRMLSAKGRPEIQTLHKVLEAFGLKLEVAVDGGGKARRAA